MGLMYLFIKWAMIAEFILGRIITDSILTETLKWRIWNDCGSVFLDSLQTAGSLRGMGHCGYARYMAKKMAFSEAKP